MDYLSDTHTNPSVLLKNLGSFWNQVFQEKETLRGYTTGMAEEVIQLYYNLVETINSYSVKDIPALHTEKWYPIVVKRSDFNQSPLIFNPNDSVVGPQPESDIFYRSQVFKFGFPKTSNENVYAVKVPNSFTKFSVVANRIINPSLVLVNGVDVILQNNTLYFNSNVFDNSLVPKVDLIDDFGKPVLFTDLSGVAKEDQMIVLWSYHVGDDQKFLSDNFGFIYQLDLPSTDTFKEVLKAIVNIAVNGASVHALKSVLASFVGIPVVLETQETIEQITRDKYNLVVSTDQHSYKFSNNYTVLPSVVVGSKVRAGDILIDAIQYFDAATSHNWWESAFEDKPKTAFSSHIFLGNYKFQLFFKNTLDLVTLSNSNILNFPVDGRVEDVAAFQAHINIPENREAIKTALGLKLDGANSVLVVPIIPTQFLFNNFFKNNTALLKLNFFDIATTISFFNYVDLIKEMLPSHVYLLFSIDFHIPVDTYAQLNGTLTIDNLAGKFNADGSNAAGYVENIAPYGYKNIEKRLFALGHMPSVGGDPISDPSVRSIVKANGTTGADAYVNDGRVKTVIPAGATTRTVRTVFIG